MLEEQNGIRTEVKRRGGGEGTLEREGGLGLGGADLLRRGLRRLD